jgi:hypothetical protein
MSADAWIVPREELCLPKSVFAIGGIACTSTKKEVIRLKGNPIQTISDDTMLIETWVYEDMNVIVSGGDEILSVWTSSPNHVIAPGIHCGMSRDDAMMVLGITSYNKELKELQVPNCSTIDHMIITFNDNNVIERIDMGIGLP